MLTVYHALKWLHTTFGSINTVSPRLKRWSMQLAPYNFNIIYRSGGDNVVADALSRNPWYNADEVELPLLANRSIEEPVVFELEAKQSTDPFCKRIIRYIKEQKTKQFFLDQEKILKRISIIAEVKVHQIVAPASETQKLIYHYHNEGSHLGVNKTYQRMSLKYF